jgi:2-amino-4-hydroxy-6-hydroxymethyldihydropteridine diphosphokinase
METRQHVAFLSLGSNLGDRAEVLRSAVQALIGKPLIELDVSRDVASLYETSPVGARFPQPRFLNTAAQLRTRRPPHDILHLILDVESSLGRRRGEHGEPRVIDIDLLLFDDLAIEGDELTVPHPRLAERRFALEPLAEIAPNVVHPRLGLTMGELARQARAEHEGDEVIRIAGPEWVLSHEPVT